MRRAARHPELPAQAAPTYGLGRQTGPSVSSVEWLLTVSLLIKRSCGQDRTHLHSLNELEPGPDQGS